MAQSLSISPAQKGGNSSGLLNSSRIWTKSPRDTARWKRRAIRVLLQPWAVMREVGTEKTWNRSSKREERLAEKKKTKKEN